jgi:membrane-associated phospholipid phosphatase
MNRVSVTLLALLCWSPASIALSQTAAPPDERDEPSQTIASVDTPDPADEPLRIGALFKEFGRELVGLRSKDTAITLGLGGAFALAVHPVDQALTLMATRSTDLGRVLAPGDVIGVGWVQGTAAITTFLLGHATRNRRMQAVGLDLVQAGAIVYVTTKSLKLTIDRERPDDGRYSFPSGHAATTFANATVVQRHFGWKAGLPAYGLATYVSISRLPDKRHYASDIVFGAAIGLVAGRTVTVGRGQAAFTVTPMPVPGGGGVMLQRASPIDHP